MKCSKPQLRQKDERLCFFCNQLGHLKRNCPEFPYCAKCRTKGHTPDKCTSNPQQNGLTHETPEKSRDQWRRNQDLPQFSNQNNRCLHCVGDHQTRDCATQQRQTPTTNNPASSAGTSTHGYAPNIPCYTSSQSNTQSPASHQHSQSTIHVQTPTLNIIAPHFQPNLHHAQNTQPTNYHTHQQQIHTLPIQPFNTRLPQLNPQVPPPYFPQYPPTNSPSMNSTDSSILLALQKQLERQEKLDMESNEMERQKEERRRMKEEREQRKEERK